MSDPKLEPVAVPLPTIVILPQPIEHMKLELVLHGNTQYASALAGKIVHALMPAVEQRREFAGVMQGDVVVTKPVLWAVCSASSDQVMAALRAELETVRDEARQAHDALIATEAMVKERDTAINGARVDVARHERLGVDLSHKLQEKTKINNKLEADLAKVRAHFGQKALDEALAK